MALPWAAGMQPYLQIPRPAEGWALAVAAGDAHHLQDQRRSASDSVAVRCFASFLEMLEHHGVEACLPVCSSLEVAVQTYHSLANRSGETYAQLESSNGVVAIELEPLVASGSVARRVSGLQDEA